jgi:RNA 2',3'-cyclic 3'-phosphodiesterase
VGGHEDGQVSRLFVALVPPARVVAPLLAPVDDARPLAPELAWAQPARWHITLAFLGEVAADALADLDWRLSRVAQRHAPMELRLRGAGRFGQAVLFCQVEGDLADLVAELRGTAGSAPADDRPSHPHLTLARARPGHPVDLRTVVAELEGLESPSWRADRISLIRSRAGAGGGYEEQAAWPLTGKAPTVAAPRRRRD